MKNSNHYINLQTVDVSRKPTTCEIIRNILWYAAQFVGCVLVFAIMYIVIIFASAF